MPVPTVITVNQVNVDFLKTGITVSNLLGSDSDDLATVEPTDLADYNISLGCKDNKYSVKLLSINTKNSHYLKHLSRRAVAASMRDFDSDEKVDEFTGKADVVTSSVAQPVTLFLDSPKHLSSRAVAASMRDVDLDEKVDEFTGKADVVTSSVAQPGTLFSHSPKTRGTDLDIKDATKRRCCAVM